MHLVPFRDNWTGSETKLDLKAIYRRPGVGVHLTSPLPLRRHKDWARKGFAYVCLSSLEELGMVAGELRASGVDPMVMRDCFDPITGHFKVDAYLAEQQGYEDAHLMELQAKVDKFGLEAVTEMMRLSNPSFVMPDSITAPKARKAEKAIA